MGQHRHAAVSSFPTRLDRTGPRIQCGTGTVLSTEVDCHGLVTWYCTAYEGTLLLRQGIRTVQNCQFTLCERVCTQPPTADGQHGRTGPPQVSRQSAPLDPSETGAEEARLGAMLLKLRAPSQLRDTCSARRGCCNGDRRRWASCHLVSTLSRGPPRPFSQLVQALESLLAVDSRASSSSVRRQFRSSAHPGRCWSAVAQESGLARVRWASGSGLKQSWTTQRHRSDPHHGKALQLRCSTVGRCQQQQQQQLGPSRAAYELPGQP